jgi:polyhydroxybutyrate depolymerase
VKKHVNVDLDRVYATGLSNGGFMSYRLACEAADIFAAVAPGAGALTTNGLGWGGTDSDFAECTPSEHVSVLDIHGTADGIVPYELQARSLELISQKNGCGSATAPSGAPRSAGDTTCVSYKGCPDGVEVTGCTVEGGGHVWFGSDSCGTGAGAIGCSFVGANSTTMVNTDEVWDFFARHSK